MIQPTIDLGLHCFYWTFDFIRYNISIIMFQINSQDWEFPIKQRRHYIRIICQDVDPTMPLYYRFSETTSASCFTLRLPWTPCEEVLYQANTKPQEV